MRYIKAGISICITWIKFTLLKIFHRDKFQFSWISRCAPDSLLEISGGGTAKLRKHFKMRSGAKLIVRGNGVVRCDENVFFNYNAVMVCYESIVIGRNVQIAPGVQIYDQDHDFRCKEGIKALKYKTSPVTIGNDVWIGANSVILRGTTIGDNTIIGAGCIIKGNIPANSIITQKRDTCVSPIDTE